MTHSLLAVPASWSEPSRTAGGEEGRYVPSVHQQTYSPCVPSEDSSCGSYSDCSRRDICQELLVIAAEQGLRHHAYCDKGQLTA